MAKKLGFNATVGRKRISSSVDSSTASDTRSARMSMRRIINNYRKFVGNVEAALPEILKDALEETFDKSKEYCPKDTGALVESGYLEITGFRGQTRVEIGYGKGGDPEYAAKVHENLEFRHKSPTRAKWLQIALEEDANKIQSKIVQGLRI